MGQMRRDDLVKQYNKNAVNAERIRELEQQLAAANVRVAELEKARERRFVMPNFDRESDDEKDPSMVEPAPCPRCEY